MCLRTRKKVDNHINYFIFVLTVTLKTLYQLERSMSLGLPESLVRPVVRSRADRALFIKGRAGLWLVPKLFPGQRIGLDEGMSRGLAPCNTVRI